MATVWVWPTNSYLRRIYFNNINIITWQNQPRNVIIGLNKTVSFWQFLGSIIRWKHCLILLLARCLVHNWVLTFHWIAHTYKMRAPPSIQFSLRFIAVRYGIDSHYDMRVWNVRRSQSKNWLTYEWYWYEYIFMRKKDIRASLVRLLSERKNKFVCVCLP